MKKEARKFNPIIGPVLVPIIFFIRELTGLTVFAGFDFTHLILPFHQFARDAVNSGHLPEWNPYLFAGFPQLAEGEGGFFYPGNLLMLLPGEQSIWLSWTIVLHIILAGILMYAFLRNRGVSEFSSSWMAVFYELLPGLLLRAETTGLFEAVAWLPGLFLCLERAGQFSFERDYRGWLRWVLLSGAVVAMMLLAGSSQIAFYGMLGGFFYLCGFAWTGPDQGRRALWCTITLIITGIMAIVLAAIQVVPTSIFSAMSHRVQGADYEYYRMGTWLNFPRLASLFTFPSVKNPTDILDYISSLGYIGLLPFILVGITLTRFRNRMNPILAPFILLFFGVLLSFGMNLVVNRDLLSFPGFNLFRAMGRMILPTTVAMFALGGFGLDLLLNIDKNGEDRRDILNGIRVSMILALIMLIWFLVYEGFPPTGFEIIAISGFLLAGITIMYCLIGYIRTKNTKWLVGLLTIWAIGHFVTMTSVKSSFTMPRNLYSDAIAQLSIDNNSGPSDEVTVPRAIVGIDMDVWDPLLERMAKNPFGQSDVLPVPAFGNELSMAKVGVLDAYTPLITERWHQVAHEYAAKGLVQTVNSEASVRLRQILSILGADMLITPENFVGGADFTVLPNEIDRIFPDNWHVLSAPDPVEYVSIPEYVEAWDYSGWEYFKHWIVRDDYVPGKWVCVEIGEDADLPDSMEWEESRTAVVEITDSFGNVGPSFPSVAGTEISADKLYRIENVVRFFNGEGLIKIDVDVETPCWVVIRESAMDGWTATVDNRPEKIYTADYLFMGVPVSEGSHTIVLNYETPGLSQGMKITLAGIIIWVLLLAGCSVRSRR